MSTVSWIALSPKLKELVNNFKSKNTSTYSKIFAGVETNNLTSSQVVKILSLIDGVVVRSTEFKSGDVIASYITIRRGSLIFFQASSEDVDSYSKRNRIYYILQLPYSKYYKI